jgi:hypothetical protein
MLGNTIKYSYGEIGIVLLGVIALYISSIYDYLFFHSAVEFFTIIISTSISLIVWNERQRIDNGYLLFLGITFFFISCLDFLHALSYEGMGVFTSYDPGL